MVSNYTTWLLMHRLLKFLNAKLLINWKVFQENPSGADEPSLTRHVNVRGTTHGQQRKIISNLDFLLLF
jgi:hypothetical protein